VPRAAGDVGGAREGEGVSRGECEKERSRVMKNSSHPSSGPPSE
jgi:hypothetical protein